MNAEEKLKQMLVEVEAARDRLRVFNTALRNYYDRLQDVLVQHKRRHPITDTSFEEDFKVTVHELRQFADYNLDFWLQTRADFQKANKAQLVMEHRLLIKQINAAALNFTRGTDELFTVFKNLQVAGKELPLRLNWWVLGSASDDLFKTTNRILFMMRDLEKRYD